MARPRPSLVGIAQRVLPGVRATLGRTTEFAAWWEAGNAAALAGGGPFWVALGDSTAQGIGARSPDLGYVGQLRRLLVAAEGQPWRVVNLSKTGARTADVADLQLARMQALGVAVDLVTCAVGGNDLLWRTPASRFDAALERLLEALPAGAVVATLPQGLGRKRPPEINDRIRRRAGELGLRVADLWPVTGPPWRENFAGDGFHPNERGYAAWAGAFAGALGLSPSAPGPPSPDR